MVQPIHIQFDELAKAYNAFDYSSNADQIFFNNEEDFDLYLEKGYKFWQVECELLTPLTSDNNYHGPVKGYYKTADDILVIRGDDAPYYTDQDWIEGLIECLGEQHPSRVINTIKEFSSYLDQNKEYIIKNDDDNLSLDSIYEVVEENWVDGIPSMQNRKGDLYEGTAIQVEGKKKIKYEKSISYYQGSADYYIDQVKEI